MEIKSIASGRGKAITVKETVAEDFKFLTKKRFSFIWKTFRNSTTVFKLQIAGEDDILGVMGLIDWPEEKRIEIKLLASSKENIGKQKMYDGIAGCLIAFACRLAVHKYGPDACVSLVPKTELIKHYMQKYHMADAGRQLYVDGNDLIKMLKKYL